jgi:hypothetical protein
LVGAQRVVTKSTSASLTGYRSRQPSGRRSIALLSYRFALPLQSDHHVPASTVGPKQRVDVDNSGADQIYSHGTNDATAEAWFVAVSASGNTAGYGSVNRAMPPSINVTSTNPASR